MRKCKGQYTKYDETAGGFTKISFEEGVFHQWGNDFEEHDSGPANYTVAIVELPNGEVVMPIASSIQFTS